ncbi:MAG TPA: hypothetical protein ENJ45_01935 [Phaeodactylibacter sp.]|nr:hypothetical protein [Phaeodactylibacter sp.]
MRIFLLFFVFCLSANVLSAQSTRDASIQKIGKDLLHLIESNIAQRHTDSYGTDTASLNELYNLSDPRFQLANKAMIQAQRAAQAKKNLGLDFKWQYFLNTDSFLDDDENDAENDAFDNRARFGFQWELLSGGLFGNRHKAKKLLNTQKLENLKHDLEINDVRLFLRYNIMIFIFNEAKIKLLRHSLLQVQQELELLYKVYFLKGILYEEILKAKSKLEQMKVQIENYESYNRWIENTLDIPDLGKRFQNEKLPIFEINLNYVMDDQHRELLADSLRRLEENIQKYSNKAIDEISLKLQLYQYLGANDGLGLTDKSYLSAGFSLNVPMEIFFDRKVRQKLQQEQISQRVDFNNYAHINEKSEIINYYYEYNYKLKSFMEFLYKEMLYQERIRMEIVNHRDFADIHRSLRILRLMDDLRSIRLEMIDLKQQMYLLLLKIYGNTHYRSVLPVIQPIDMAGYYLRLPASRTITIDEAALKQFDAAFITNYLLSNGIQRVIFADYSSSTNQKEKALFAKLRKARIAVWRSMPAGDRLGSFSTIEQIITKQMMGDSFDGILLDFSHLPKGEKQKVQEYLLANLDLWYRLGDKICIQIDKGYSRELIGTLAKAVNKIIIMPESKADIDYLRKVANISSAKSNTAILIEANKFKDRIELEAYIDMLHEVYNVKHVNIIGFRDFISLDSKTLVDMD